MLSALHLILKAGVILLRTVLKHISHVLSIDLFTIGSFISRHYTLKSILQDVLMGCVDGVLMGCDDIFWFVLFKSSHALQLGLSNELAI